MYFVTGLILRVNAAILKATLSLDCNIYLILFQRVINHKMCASYLILYS